MSKSNNSNNSDDHFSRRDFLKTSALSGLAIGPFIVNSCKNGTSNGQFKHRGEAKNIIFMVSDGMSSGTLNMADMLKYRMEGKHSNWIEVYNSDRTFHRGLMDTASLNSLVTDSAAAGSSWGSGHRINNGAINTGPGGEQYTPINRIFKDVGKKVGLVTTTRITHATPAAFSVQIDDRNKEDRIAELYLQHEYDLLMGGGSRHFTASDRSDGQDLLKKFGDTKYHIARDKRELQQAPDDQRLLGLFHEGHLPYSINHQSIDKYRKSIPTLAEMTRQALQRLDSQEGFILQVEGGRVDHGAHDNDASALLFDQLAFDDAVEVALEYVDQREDTLLVITTDHGNANPALNGAGNRYEQTNKQFDRMQEMKYSNTWVLSGLDGNSTISRIRERVKEATNIGIKKEEAEALKKSLNDNLETLFDIQSASDAVLGSILANYTAINFTSGNHTSDYVELAAIGPGSGNLDYFTRNTEIFDFLLNAAGVSAADQV